MPIANAFLIINLGCEMLYVIDQRLKAQRITLEKSTQVLRDLTCVLLDPRFLDQLLQSHCEHYLLTPQQCRLLLNDIACCSLMRLDIQSMDKLWDLMIMVFKWQLLHIKDPQHLLDVTFRHMDGVGRLIPETRKTVLIDCAKRHLIEFWDGLGDVQRNQLLKHTSRWIQPFNVKISILIRLGFQRLDGTFETDLISDHYKYFIDNIGENIYVKHANLISMRMMTGDERKIQKKTSSSHELASLVDQLNIKHPINTDANQINNILDEVSFALESEMFFESDTKESELEKSEFTYLTRTRPTLESILEKFNFNLDKSNESADKEFNVTDELLKMLDEK